MKLLGVFILLALLSGIVFVMLVFARDVFQRVGRKAKWRVVPRSTGDAASFSRQLWLCKAGEEDFLFWPTKGNKSWDFDRAQMEAEIQASEFNRMNKELTR